MWLLAGCAGFFEIGSERGTGSPDGEPISWSGYVYASPDTSTGAMVEDGPVSFVVDGEEEPVEAEQPYENYPGYWSVTLAPGVKTQIELTSAAAWPTVWRATAPETDAAWLGGALVAADTAFMDEFVGALPLGPLTSVDDLADGEVTHLLGTPLDDGWDCAQVTVAGEPADCFAVGDDGTVTQVDSGSFDYFFAFNLEPGDIVVDSGLGGGDTYSTRGGDWIFALYFQGAP